jgi:hypothetical protein
MNFGKKQMIIGAAVLVAGYLVYKKFYAKPAVAPVTPASPEDQAAAAAAAALAADEATLTADEDLTDEVITGASTPESFLGRGKRKKKPMGNRKERIAKFYLGLLKRGVDPTGAFEMIAKKIKGNKSSKEAQAAAMTELAEVVSTPKATLNEVAEARTVGGGDGFLSQSFMM